jgi:hypothetical protein
MRENGRGLRHPRRLTNSVLPGLIVAGALLVASLVPTRDSGVDVTVLLAGRCPARSCPARPYRAFIRARRLPSGEYVAGNRARADGRLRFRFGPGRYELVPVGAPGRSSPRARHVIVHVRAARFVRARVIFRAPAPPSHSRRPFRRRSHG